MESMRMQIARATGLFAAMLMAFALLAPAAFADEDPAGEDGAQATAASNRVNVNQLPDSSFLYDTAISELSDADSFHDGQTVQVRGEAVGELVNAEFDPDHCWLTIQESDASSPSTVAVYVSREKASLVDGFGAFGKTGSQVQVRGTYHLVCAEHQGLSDIHADELSILGKSADAPVRPNSSIAAAAAISVIIGGICLVGYRIMRDQEK